MSSVQAAYVLRDERVSSPVGPAGHSLVRLGECSSARGPGRWGSLQIEQKGRKGSMRRDVRTKDVKMDDGVKGKVEEEVRGRSREKGEVDWPQKLRAVFFSFSTKCYLPRPRRT